MRNVTVQRILWVAVTPLVVWAQAPSEPEAGIGPRLVAEPTHLDLGTVREGGTYDLSFVLKNEGTQTLVISKMISSCSCAVLHPQKNRLEPGESMTLNASLDTTQLSGQQTKTITLYTNAVQDPVVELTFTARVQAPYRLIPEDQITFSNKRPAEALDTSVILIPGKSSDTLELLEVDIDRPEIGYVSEAYEHAGAKGLRFTFRIVPDAPSGTICTLTTFRFRIADEEFEACVPILGNIITEIAVWPRMLLALEPVLPGEVVPYGRVTLRAIKQGEGFRILRVMTGPALTYEIHKDEQQGGLVYHVDFSVAARAAAGSYADDIKLFTDNPSQPVIIVPAYVVVGTEVEMVPPVVYLHRQAAGDATVSQLVRLYCRRCHDFQVVGVSSDDPHVLVAVQEAGDEDHVPQLVVTLAPDAPVGRLEALLTVHTDVAHLERVTLPVYGEIVAAPAVGQKQPLETLSE